MDSLLTHEISFEITNGELLDFISVHDDMENPNLKLAVKHRNLAEFFIKDHSLINGISLGGSMFPNLQKVKTKDEVCCGKVKIFLKDISQPQTKQSRPIACTIGQPCQTLSNNPCGTVHHNILQQSLSTIEKVAEEQGLAKAEFLKKMVLQACKSRDWDMSSFFTSYETNALLPTEEIAALIYVADLSQRQ